MNWIIGALKEIGGLAFIVGCFYGNLRVGGYVENYYKRKNLVAKTGASANDKRKFLLFIISISLAFFIIEKFLTFSGLVFVNEESKKYSLVISFVLFSIVPLSCLIYVPLSVRLGLYDKKQGNE